MQLDVIHLLEAALVKVANSQGSLHHLSLAALEPPFQSVFFSQSFSDAQAESLAKDGQGEYRQGSMTYLSPGHRPY